MDLGEGKGAFRLGGGRRGRLRGRVWRRLGLRPTGSLRRWRTHRQCLPGVGNPPHTCSCFVFLLLPSSIPPFPPSSFPCSNLDLVMCSSLFLPSLSHLSIHDLLCGMKLVGSQICVPISPVHVLCSNPSPSIYLYLTTITFLHRCIRTPYTSSCGTSFLDAARLMLRSSSRPSSRSRSSQMEWQVRFVCGLSSPPYTVYSFTLPASSCHWSYPSVCLFVFTYEH